MTKLECAGIISANYEHMIPISAKLADMYVTASVDTANVEREFSKQNLILTSLRNRTLISNMSKKVCNKGYLQALRLSDDVTEGILNSAAIRFKNMKKRRQFKLVRK